MMESMRRVFTFFKTITVTAVLLLITMAGLSQEIKVSGGFVKDSIQIGEPVAYYLSTSYPQSLTVLFPDSIFNFAPFEYSRKAFYPTVTSNGISRDSVIYYLATFEVDKV